MSLTNAQAALQAAATAFQGRMKANITGEVLRLADQYKQWLDHQDAPPPTPPRSYSRGGVIREPTELKPEVKISAAVFFRHHDERCCSRDTGDEKDCCCKTR